MSYMHIDNLYKPEAQRILEFKWVYAMEKIHGTSSHISWKDNQLHFFAGGISHDVFIKLFDHEILKKQFEEMGHPVVIIFGEAYGGKIMRMGKVYGPDIRFIAFEVKIGDAWLDVDKACHVVSRFGLDFVYYEHCATELEKLTVIRDTPSMQARRLSMGEHPREGIVLRPPFEVTLNNGERLIAKYKTEAFCERTKEPKPGDRLLQTQGDDAANEWVTTTRLEHIIDDLKSRGINVSNITATGVVIKAMHEDIAREGSEEVVLDVFTTRAIGRRTANLFKFWLQAVVVETPFEEQ